MNYTSFAVTVEGTLCFQKVAVSDLVTPGIEPPGQLKTRNHSKKIRSSCILGLFCIFIFKYCSELLFFAFIYCSELRPIALSKSFCIPPPSTLVHHRLTHTPIFAGTPQKTNPSHQYLLQLYYLFI